MPNSHQDNPSMAQHDPNIDPSSSEVFVIHLKDCPSMAPNHWRTTYPHHTMALKQQPTPHDPARRNARERLDKEQNNKNATEQIKNTQIKKSKTLKEIT